MVTRSLTRAARLAIGSASLALLAGCTTGATPAPSATPTAALASPAASSRPSLPASSSPSPIEDWFAAPEQPTVSGVQYHDVVWTGDRFVATGAALDGGSVFLDSADGRTWHRQGALTPESYPGRLAVGPLGVVAVGDVAGHPASWVSSDGLSWTVAADAFSGSPAGTDTVSVTDVVATDGGWLVSGGSTRRATSTAATSPCVRWYGPRATGSAGCPIGAKRRSMVGEWQRSRGEAPGTSPLDLPAAMPRSGHRPTATHGRGSRTARCSARIPIHRSRWLCSGWLPRRTSSSRSGWTCRTAAVPSSPGGLPTGNPGARRPSSVHSTARCSTSPRRPRASSRPVLGRAELPRRDLGILGRTSVEVRRLGPIARGLWSVRVGLVVVRAGRRRAHLGRA